MTTNVAGYLWAKEAYGAMLFATAVSDLSIADALADPAYRPLYLALAREVLAQATAPPEPFDGFDPDDLDGSIDRLVEFNRGSAKTHSGIYRDLAVRHRKTEVDAMLGALEGPLIRRTGELIHAVERLRRSRCLGEHLAGEGQVERPVGRVGQGVGDRQIGHRRREEHRAVGLLRPEIPGDVRRHLRVGDVGRELPNPVGVAPVELADPERRPVPAQDPARPHNVGAEVDERPDDAPLAHGRHDLGLVESVLERDDVPARREPGRDRLHRVAGVVRLHRQEHMVELGREVVGRRRPGPGRCTPQPVPRWRGRRG